MRQENYTTGLTRRTALKIIGAGMVSTSSLIAGTNQSSAQEGRTGEWRMFQVDSRNTGFHADTTGPKQDITVRWSPILTLEEDPYLGPVWMSIKAGPVISNNTIYVSDARYFHALHRESGKQRWKFLPPDGSIHSTPTVDDGKVFAVGRSLYALNAFNGNVIWRFEIPSPFSAHNSPVVADSTVFFGDGAEGRLHAIDSETGEEIWQFEASGGIRRSAPAVVGDTIYFGSRDNRLYALDKLTGEEIWSYKTEGNVSSPTVTGGVVYTNGGDSMYAIDAESGTKQWKFSTQGSITGSPAVASGTVYIGSFDNNLYAVSASNGDELWRFSTGDRIMSSPAIVDNVVYFGGVDHNIYAVDAEQGTELWQFTTGRQVTSSPAVVGGTLYIGSEDGRLYALEEKREQQPPWARENTSK